MIIEKRPLPANMDREEKKPEKETSERTEPLEENNNNQNA